jgi:putative FmdB family regulatory protein
VFFLSLRQNVYCSVEYKNDFVRGFAECDQEAHNRTTEIEDLMPVYSFHCKSCGKEFDKILKTQDISAVTCTFCESFEIKRTKSKAGFLQKSGTGVVPAGALSGGSCRSGFS